MLEIRAFETQDWAGVWSVLEPVLRAGESYPLATDISEAEARRLWIDVPAATVVAVDDQHGIVGSYYLKPNQPALGSHVCNCGYVVVAGARQQGIGGALCEHSQRLAVSLGFRAMQYNLVVATNEPAVRLWQRQGFDIVGRLPGAFRHAERGFVDAFVMYKTLR